MTIKRKTVGEPVMYKEHCIEAKFLGPDLLCYVDGLDFGNFYVTREAAITAGKSYIDELEKSNGTK